MSESGFRHVYGPVPSRRLGRSLGVDLVPLKTCTYDCVYCQLGRTTKKTTERREYVPVGEVLSELAEKLARGPRPDFVSLAGSGEPTLHAGIGGLISRIKTMTDIPVAVITNGSLLSKPEVREALMEADLVLPSLDAGDDAFFRRVNRPHPEIDFDEMVEGLVTFSHRFGKPVWLEVFVLEGLTGVVAHVEKIAALAARMAPARVQLNTVARPPAEGFALPVPAAWMETFAGLFSCPCEVIAGAKTEGAGLVFASTVTDEEILGLLARRPCTTGDVAAGLHIHVTEAGKRLQVLIERGLVALRRKDGIVFHEAGRKA